MTEKFSRVFRVFLGASILFQSIPATASPSSLATPAASPQPALVQRFNSLPLSFTENKGQWPADILYQGTRGDSGLRFLRNGLSFFRVRKGQDRETLVWNLEFLGSRAENPKITASGEQPGVTNFLLGNDSKQWLRNLPSRREITYHNVYHHTDLVFHSQGKNLKYDFILRPGADAKDIRLGFKGIDSLAVNRAGDLEVHTRWGTVLDKAPAASQSIRGQKLGIKVQYFLFDKTSYGFQVVGDYDPNYELVIDPLTVEWSTFLGAAGSINDTPTDVAIDMNDDVYITGYADAKYPTTPGVYQRSFKGGLDAFVTKMSKDGTNLIYSTFVGGTAEDNALGIAVNDAGEVFVSGQTSSLDFPTTPGAFQRTASGGVSGGLEAFVFRLNANGSALVYSTYLGGNGVSDSGRDIAINAANQAFVAGLTDSKNFPTTPGAFQTAIGGSFDAFVSRLNDQGSALIYSTYLGGTALEQSFALALNKTDEAFVTGVTQSGNFPVTPGVYQSALAGVGDVFVAKLNSTGTGLVYSTFLGGKSYDQGQGIAVNDANEAFLTGQTISADFPVTPGALQSVGSSNGSQDAFVTRLNAQGTNLLYSTYLAGKTYDSGFGIVITSQNEAVVSGFTDSTNFPTTPGAFQPALAGGFDLFISHIANDGKSFASGGSTFLGGTKPDGAFAATPNMALDPRGKFLYISGVTFSIDFPIQDRFGVKGPGANVYESVKPNPGQNLADPFVIKIGVPEDTCPPNDACGVCGSNAAACAPLSVKTQMTFDTDPDRSNYPDVGSAYAVWISSSGGPASDVRLTRLGDPVGADRIISDPEVAYRNDPKVTRFNSHDYAAWHRSWAHQDVMLYDVQADEYINVPLPAGMAAGQPDLTGQYLAWLQTPTAGGTPDVMLFDLAKLKRIGGRQVIDPADVQNLTRGNYKPTLQKLSVSIQGDVVWTNITAPGNLARIFLYDHATGNIGEVDPAGAPGYARDVPDIDYKMVAWREGTVSGASDFHVRLYRLQTSAVEFVSPSTPSNIGEPRLSGNLLVWAQEKHPCTPDWTLKVYSRGNKKTGSLDEFPVLYKGIPYGVDKNYAIYNQKAFVAQHDASSPYNIYRYDISGSCQY